RGMAAYAYHAMVLGYTDKDVNEFFYEGLIAVGGDLSIDELLGVGTKLGCSFKSKAVILATGVYLNSKIYMGEVAFYEGPNALG
ncbi:FAD-dependent oxidoreductase, partial [Clostridioides difficile]